MGTGECKEVVGYSLETFMLILKKESTIKWFSVFSILFLLMFSVQVEGWWQPTPDSGFPLEPSPPKASSVTGDSLALVWKSIKESGSSSGSCSSGSCSSDSCDTEDDTEDDTEASEEESSSKEPSSDDDVSISDFGNVKGHRNKVENDIEITIE